MGQQNSYLTVIVVHLTYIDSCSGPFLMHVSIRHHVHGHCQITITICMCHCIFMCMVIRYGITLGLDAVG